MATALYPIDVRQPLPPPRLNFAQAMQPTPRAPGPWHREGPPVPPPPPPASVAVHIPAATQRPTLPSLSSILNPPGLVPTTRPNPTPNPAPQVNYNLPLPALNGVPPLYTPPSLPAPLARPEWFEATPPAPPEPPARKRSTTRTTRGPRGIGKPEVKRRTKTGCLTCRKRRIKCDERHPTCANCEKSKRVCSGYATVFVDDQLKHGTNGSARPQHLPQQLRDVGPSRLPPLATVAQPGVLAAPYGYIPSGSEPRAPALPPLSIYMPPGPGERR